ncbi:MAG: 23S rRNA (uracil(1939)-C(5))-methyltransferase RlmD [Bacteroidota bacterium]
MGKKKKKIVERVTITGIADKGRSVGRDEEGQVLFVDRVAPGDVVDVMVLKKKNGYMEGIPKVFHTYSEDRVDPFCQHYGVCGGCRWQHVSYEAQLVNKEQVVRHTLKRIGKVKIEQFFSILPSDPITYYRNKMEFTFSNKRWLTRKEIDEGVSNFEDVLGFHRPGAFDKIVNIKHCFLQEEPSNHVRNTLRQIAHDQSLTFFDLRNKAGFLRNVMVRITTTGEIMLILSFFEEDVEKRTAYLDEILKQLPEVTSLHYCINGKPNDFILDLDIHTYKGPGFIEEMLGDVRFQIGPKSFFQTNTRQAVRLFNVVRDFADLQGTENVYDLYTGIGSIALYLAKSCKQIVGIEEVEMAIKDAKINSKLNGIENTIFYAGDVREILGKEFAEKHGRPDVLITDPPRAGMHKNVVRILLKLEAPKIVYVSCNPATQARDLNLLSAKYDVIKVQPVDMFPHTHHIETVALLQLRSTRSWWKRLLHPLISS